MAKDALPPALVMGDLNLVRCLGRVGVPLTLATAEPERLVSRSRYLQRVQVIPDDIEDPAAAAEALLAIPWPDGTVPSLFYQTDHDLLLVSRFRERLARRYRFVIPPAELVEDLAIKSRFLDRCQREELPIPRTRIVRAGGDVAVQLADWREFPCVVKPSVDGHWWDMVGWPGVEAWAQKALLVAGPAELRRLCDTVGVPAGDLIVQEYVPGGEERVVSFHAYVRAGGECVSAFTGRKIRTYPRTFGHSCYVEITDEERVQRAGREIVAQLGFHGVLKIDFKEDPRDGRLRLLEINPRFSLWHYPAAVAGANLPAMVHRDLHDLDWPLSTTARPGMRWLWMKTDVQAFREYRAAGLLTLGGWLRSLWAPSVYEPFAWDDPAPLLAGLWAPVGRRLARLRRSG